MRNFHGFHRTSCFFEGWYLKHQAGGYTIAFIPAYHVDESGVASASIQVITNHASYLARFPSTAFLVHPRRFLVKIGENVFCDKGVKIHFRAKGLSVDGTLRYHNTTPLPYPAMGPFSMAPGMQCNHGVLSLSHRLTGSLTVNGEKISFHGGTGYIEKDWGSSFPSSYLWTQSNFYHKGDCCVMISAADVPFLNTHFPGCICVVYDGNKQYRIATYLGARILKHTSREIIIRQGPYLLQAVLLYDNPFELKAPVMGGMSRNIHESPACTVRYRFWADRKLILDETSKQAGFEHVASKTSAKGDV